MKTGNKYELVRRYADRQIEGSTWYQHRWYYIEGLVLKGYMDIFAAEGNEAYRRYVKDFVDGLLDGKGGIRGFDWSDYNIDHVNMGKVLFDLHARDGDPRYRKTLDDLHAHLLAFPRTREGNFWHKDIYPFQVWLDGLYMGQPLLARYIREFAAVKDYSDTLRQFANVRKLMYDPDRRLYLHAYDESRSMPWADPRTGLSLNVWARACGWHVMAMVDVLEILGGEACDLSPLRAQLLEAIEGLLEYQDGGGMWHQVVDMGNRKGNYLESSGTLMIAYALLKGARLGYLPSGCMEAGRRAFDGCIGAELSEKGGEVMLAGICRSAGLGGEKMRPGTFGYYVSEDVVANNGHGIGALLLAWSEMLRLP